MNQSKQDSKQEGRSSKQGTDNVHIISLNQFNDAERAGSLKRDTFILAVMPEETEGKDVPAEWHLAKIVESAISKTPEGSFKYYITYVGHNRRLDRWISEHQLISDPAKVALA